MSTTKARKTANIKIMNQADKKEIKKILVDNQANTPVQEPISLPEQQKSTSTAQVQTTIASLGGCQNAATAKNFTNLDYLKTYFPPNSEPDFGLLFPNHGSIINSPKWWTFRTVADNLSTADDENFDSNGNLTIVARKSKRYRCGSSPSKEYYYKTYRLKKAFKNTRESILNGDKRYCSWRQIKNYLNDIPQQLCETVGLQKGTYSDKVLTIFKSNGALAYKVVINRVDGDHRFQRGLIPPPAEALQLTVRDEKNHVIGKMEWKFGGQDIHMLMVSKNKYEKAYPRVTTRLGEHIIKQLLMSIMYHGGAKDIRR